MIIGRSFAEKIDTSSDWVRRELELAKKRDKRIVPVFLDRDAIRPNEL